MLRKSTNKDFEEIFNVINDAALAYKGVIPSHIAELPAEHPDFPMQFPRM